MNGVGEMTRIRYVKNLVEILGVTLYVKLCF